MDLYNSGDLNRVGSQGTPGAGSRGLGNVSGSLNKDKKTNSNQSSYSGGASQRYSSENKKILTRI